MHLCIIWYYLFERTYPTLCTNNAHICSN